ncbi:MAG: 3-isopropylmalate dehydratase [Acidobacteria bacterium]|nr:MAG: 3-isopropylmalate dehydratase [Acidobacteriota bacterium]
MITGRSWKYGNNINTDVIFPGKYTYTISEPAEMAQHALEDLDPDFAKTVQKGDILVAGNNFGCGSSREQAAIAIREAGIACIVASSFARIFFRNAINCGLMPITCPDAVRHIQHGDNLTIDPASGTLVHNEKVYTYQPLPEAIRNILKCGGLIPYTLQRLQQEGAKHGSI